MSESRRCDRCGAEAPEIARLSLEGKPTAHWVLANRAPREERELCGACLGALLAMLGDGDERGRALRRAGYVAAMRLLQSDLPLDDEERAAIAALVKGAGGKT